MKNVRRPRSRARLAPAALLVALAPILGSAFACGGDDAEPVGSLTVTPARMELPYGTFRSLDLAWSPAAELEGLEGAPRVFLHLLDDDGELVRTFDQDLPGAWRTGGESTHTARIYQSFLAPPLPPGEYTLTAGLYDAAGNRWPLGGVGEPVGEREYRVATVEVPTEGEPLPTTTFSPSWSPTQAGADRQVVAFRSLAGPGAITLSELPGPGTLWLDVRVPADQAGGFTRRVLEPAGGGDGMPRVAVTADCTGFESRLSGEGSHRVDVPVTAAGDGEGCEIALQPNFVMESPAGERRSVNLEVLAWSDR